MNLKQKTLLEKAIKLKYNGMINSVKAIVTKTEAGTPQPLDIYRLIHVINELEVISVDEQNDSSVRSAAHSAAMHLSHYKDEQDSQNTQTRKIVKDAKAARANVILQLQADRDKAILEVAFQDEDKDVLKWLDSIPGPEDIAIMIQSQGYELTKQLSETTGIGERSPEHLYEHTGGPC